MRYLKDYEVSIIGGGDFLTPDQGAEAELALAGIAATGGFGLVAVVAVAAAVACWGIGNSK